MPGGLIELGEDVGPADLGRVRQRIERADVTDALPAPAPPVRSADSPRDREPQDAQRFAAIGHIHGRPEGSRVIGLVHAGSDFGPHAAATDAAFSTRLAGPRTGID